MAVGSETAYNEAYSSLERIQSFDITELPREQDLGNRMNFNEALEPAEQLVELFKRLSVTALQDLPDNYLSTIKQQADSIYNLFNNILNFDPSQQDPSTARNNLINSVRASYQNVFTQLHPFISYSLHRSADFQRLDADARATLQSIEDKSTMIAGQLSQHEADAKNVLEEIRKVAAEEGVTKQAAHFNAEYEHHNTEASKWQTQAIRWAITVGVYAVLSLFIHKFPFLKPENTYDAIQLSISKFLIFSVMAYMLFLSAKNFLNHKHNAIVNKHRQNALMTHSALVEASGDEGIRDAVLLQASSCIFSPQSTGYTSQSDHDVSSHKSAIEILSKPLTSAVKDAAKS